MPRLARARSLLPSAARSLQPLSARHSTVCRNRRVDFSTARRRCTTRSTQPRQPDRAAAARRLISRRTVCSSNDFHALFSRAQIRHARTARPTREHCIRSITYLARLPVSFCSVARSRHSPCTLAKVASSDRRIRPSSSKLERTSSRAPAVAAVLDGTAGSTRVGSNVPRWWPNLSLSTPDPGAVGSASQ